MGRFGMQVLEANWRDDPQGDEEVSEEDTKDEEEEPHPLPFSPSWGRTRFSLIPPKEEYSELQSRVLGIQNNNNNENNIASLQMEPRQQRYPPLNQFWDASTVSASAMIEYSRDVKERYVAFRDETDPIDDIAQLLQSTTLVDFPIPKHADVQNQVGQRLKAISKSATNEMEKLEQWKESYVKRREKQHKEAFDSLRGVLKADHEAAKAVLIHERRQRQEHEDRLQQQEEEMQREREVQEKATRKEAEGRERLVLEQQAQKEKQAQVRAIAQHKIAELAAAKTAHVTEANELMANLRYFREEIEPFDSNKAVSKRRMNMKKMCRGRVNTISADVGKVQAVAAEVIAAIKAEKQEDDEMQAQLHQGVPHVTPEMARGQKYFIDLLASSAVVRIQAEGFNGPRGDGFPLAAFLTAVSSEIPEFTPVFEAHIYTVCPIAIPVLPKLGKEASEVDLMEALGMSKDKNGEFESFERFLHRTEGIISMVADIMSSHPENHTLFGGHKAAIKWLERFLEILPKAPDQLPLNTAPVLEGFLTGSGHMLSSLCSNEFRKLLHIVMTDITTRLDEGPIGAPRAFRLKELVKDGFEGFRKNLPARALDQLYNDGGSTPPPLPAAPAKSGFGSLTIQAPSNPFGSLNNGDLPTNPFGASRNNNTASNPFGESGVPAPSPFGANQPANPFMGANVQSPASFGSRAVSKQSSFDANQFGGVPGQGDVMNEDSNLADASVSAGSHPFGGAHTTTSFGTMSSNTSFAAAPSPFGNQPAPSPFAAQAANLTQFGAPIGASPPFATNANTIQSPFGGAGSTSSFVGQQHASSFGSSPFGVTNTTAQSTPFGNTNTQQTPFGSQSQGSSTFSSQNSRQGNAKPPCKFFAQGTCRYGDNCRFSHDTKTNDTFSGNNSSFRNSPFGGPRR